MRSRGLFSIYFGNLIGLMLCASCAEIIGAVSWCTQQPYHVQMSVFSKVGTWESGTIGTYEGPKSILFWTLWEKAKLSSTEAIRSSCLPVFPHYPSTCFHFKVTGTVGHEEWFLIDSPRHSCLSVDKSPFLYSAHLWLNWVIGIVNIFWI